MNRFTYWFITTEREGHVTHTTGDLGVRQILSDVLTAVDEVHSVVVVFFDTGSNGKDVRVEDDVLWQEADLIHQNAVGTLTDFVLTRFGIRLAGFIKGHNDHGGTVALAAFCFFDELVFTFFKRDGVHHGLALNAFQARFDDLPLGRVDHDRYAGDVRLRGNQIQVTDHGRFGIKHAFVHVNVDDLSTVFHLLTGDFQCFVVSFFFNQSFETG